jgi:hypothetical protein
MAVYPQGEFRPVRRYAPGGALHRESRGQRRVVLHTAVSNEPSLFPSMSVPGRATSHFYVDRKGRVEQYIDTDIRSTANLEGNHDCITVESWDGAGVLWNPDPPSPDPVPRWNDNQLAGLIDLVAWLCTTHQIPAVRLPSSRGGTKGIGWHRMGINGNFPDSGIFAGRVRDGELWSESRGKGCPGDARIRQVGRSIIPGVVSKMSGPPVPTGRPGPAPAMQLVSLANVEQQAQALHALPGVKLIQKALNKELGLSLRVNGLFDPPTKDAYARWQRQLGFVGDDADGIPGSLTLTRLGHGRFTVAAD